MTQPPPSPDRGWTAGPSAGDQPWHPRDPRRPLGPQPPDPVSITAFAPPPNRAPWIIAVVVAAVLAVLAFAALTVTRSPVAGPSPSPSRSDAPSPAAASAPASVDPKVDTVPFHSTRDDAQGVWTITDTRWTERGLELTMTIEVTHGTFHYQFFCLDNGTTDEFDPSPSGANSLNEGQLEEGQKVRGLVVFDKPRGDTTVFLADGLGRQITALVAEG